MKINKKIQAPSPDDEPETVVDACDNPATASSNCNIIATAEGNGKYTQKFGDIGDSHLARAARSTASGRYQFVESTAHDVLLRGGIVSTQAEAEALWNECKDSASAKCKNVQDRMCNWYSQDQLNQLERAGIPINDATRYLAWNQGVGGAKQIWNAMQNNTNVTSPTVLKNMHGQAWNFSPDGKTFYNNMVRYLNKKGIPTSG